MANRQEDAELRFAKVSAHHLELLFGFVDLVIGALKVC
jgi:hypothetical protein